MDGLLRLARAEGDIQKRAGHVSDPPGKLPEGLGELRLENIAPRTG